MNPDKNLFTLEVFDEYERRFAAARADKTLRKPWKKSDRDEIIRQAKEVLGWRDELVPTITSEKCGTTKRDGYTVEFCRFTSWEHFYGAYSLYIPDEKKEKYPLIVVCPGHGEEGRLTDCYQYMAVRLVKMGAMVLLSDNIGQGERDKLGHEHCVVPFYCGLSLQGMIAMEAAGLIRMMANDSRVDKNRIGACGNSGGGTLTAFLAATVPELTALSSSGYPSEFPYILQKERPHCACNILPHFARKIEMWELFSVFAPKPLLLEQGEFDCLIPIDLFKRNFRKVKAVYKEEQAEKRVSYAVTKTRHSWTSEDRRLIAAFFESEFDLAPAASENDELAKDLFDPAKPTVTFPPDALTTDEIAQKITGITAPEGIKLSDVFPPVFEGRKLSADEVWEDLGRGSVIRVLAQFEASL